MRLLFCFVLLISTQAIAGDHALVGKWGGVDTASRALYGSFNITKNTISWQKNANYPKGCKLTYEIKNEPSGVEFEDIDGKNIISANNQFKTYLLKITKSTCSSSYEYMRMTFPSKNDTRTFNFVTYENNGQIAGMSHFTKG